MGHVRSILLMHLAVFTVGAYTIWQTRNDDIGSMIITGVFLVYIIIVSRKNKDCIPIFAIIVIWKIIELPIAIAMFSDMFRYLTLLIVSDSLLALSVLYLYKNKLLRRVLRVPNNDSRDIKQVPVLVIVLLACVTHALLIYAEVYRYAYQGTALWAHSFFTETRTGLKIAELFVLWSMHIDSQMYWEIKRRTVKQIFFKRNKKIEQ